MNWERSLVDIGVLENGIDLGIAVRWIVPGTDGRPLFGLCWSRAARELWCVVTGQTYFLSCDPTDLWALDRGWARLEAHGSPARPEGWAS